MTSSLTTLPPLGSTLGTREPRRYSCCSTGYRWAVPLPGDRIDWVTFQQSATLSTLVTRGLPVYLMETGAGARCGSLATARGQRGGHDVLEPGLGAQARFAPRSVAACLSKALSFRFSWVKKRYDMLPSMAIVKSQ